MRSIALLFFVLVVCAALATAATSLSRVFVSPAGKDTPGAGGSSDNPVQTVSYAESLVTDDGTGIITLMPGVYTGASNIYRCVCLLCIRFLFVSEIVKCRHYVLWFAM